MRVKVGNISDLKGGGQRLLPNLGSRFARLGNEVTQRGGRLGQSAADRVENKLKAAIAEALPEDLDLNEEDQAQVLEGLGLIAGALDRAGVRTPGAVALVEGFYDAVVGRRDEGGDDDAEGIVDIIGLDASGGLVRPTDENDWK